MYKNSGKTYSRSIFSDTIHIPLTKVDKFLAAIDYALIDAVIEDPRYPFVLFGKWLIRVDREKANETWHELTHRIETGGLPYTAKISTVRNNPSLRDTVSKRKHLICIYTPNYLWREDVRKARLLLKKSGFTSRLYYRPDIITIIESRSVAGTDFRRSIFNHLRRYDVKDLEVKYRYFG